MLAGELSSAELRVRPLETLLRAAPLGLCVAGMAVMLRDTQTNEYGTVSSPTSVDSSTFPSSLL
jgi:hypothetical protein